MLVGGAAVEYYTGSRITTGDFDVIAGNDEAFADAVEAVGFRREDRAGRLLRGFYHPELPIGIELVSGFLFDGLTDRRRLGVIILDGNGLNLAPIEDMIADRLGQFEASSRRDDEMLVQARLLAELAEQLDQDYLRQRILEEGGDGSLLVHGGVSDAPTAQP